MPRPTVPTFHNVYQLKVTLLGVRPPIWRRLLVPCDLTLAQFHPVLQVAMGGKTATCTNSTLGV